mmetsp:Transcript_16084/g.38144  ORF Transcript_16084/g.38144 Transcript_16084/m.38144 type:complete len:172 (-) Transcript_16084:180-695(-)
MRGLEPSSNLEEIERREQKFRRLRHEYCRLYANRCIRRSSDGVVPTEADKGYAASVCHSLRSIAAAHSADALATGEHSPGGDLPAAVDAVSDFMVQQLEALLRDKARLAQENARLARENASLHSLLSISLSFEDPHGEEAVEEGMGGCQDRIFLAPNPEHSQERAPPPQDS